MKGQAEAIVFVLLFLIGIALFSTATIWGREIFEDNMDFTKLEAAEKLAKDIDDGISNVIKFGGKKEIEFSVQGTAEIKETNVLEIRTPLSIEIQENWVNISEGSSYIRERKEGSELILQIIYPPQAEYNIFFFTEGSSLDTPSYIRIEKGETITEATTKKIQIKVTFM
ncbi:MAG: hypothetical protein JW700_01985 [Candidatus Aenigmarchaeota archaeon]|nr:hypothetical protein [Candidatus Aenigmarchaeota archaeon]